MLNRLARPAAALTLLDVVEAVDGPVRWEAATPGPDGGPLDREVQTVCGQAAGLVRQRLRQVRLSDLVG